MMFKYDKWEKTYQLKPQVDLYHFNIWYLWRKINRKFANFLLKKYKKASFLSKKKLKKSS